MSRPVAGVRNNTLILTLPGSPKGAKENLASVIKQLPHACQQVAGADSRSLHAGGMDKLEKDAGIVSPGKASHHHHHHGHSHGHGHGHAGPTPHTKPEDRPHVSNDPNAGPTRRYRESPYPMLSVEDALKQISEHTPPPVVIHSAVSNDLVGSVLAEDVAAHESVPAFRASIVDGYAIVAGDHVLIPSTKGVFPVASISHAQMAKGETKTWFSYLYICLTIQLHFLDILFGITAFKVQFMESGVVITENYHLPLKRANWNALASNALSILKGLVEDDMVMLPLKVGLVWTLSEPGYWRI